MSNNKTSKPEPGKKARSAAKRASSESPAKERRRTIPEKPSEEAPKGEGPQPTTQRGRLRALMKKFEDHIGDEGVKVTVADYIRLLQMKRDMDEERPRDVKVTWVDNNASEE